MEYFSEEHSNHLISKEWLVKIDGNKSMPYLMKFHAFLREKKCMVMISDTRTVWAEVLSSQELARRWFQLNPNSSPHDIYSLHNVYGEWIDQIILCLAGMHTLGGVMDTLFETKDSPYADFSFELRRDEFIWRWDALTVAPRLAAEVLSRQLIMPLISATHLAFTSHSSLSEMSGNDLEKAVDKAGRAARRSADIHIKNAIMRPRLATILRRFTSVLYTENQDLPPILSAPEEIEFSLPVPQQNPYALRIPSPSSNNATALQIPRHLRESLQETELPRSDHRPSPSNNNYSAASRTKNMSSGVSPTASEKVLTPPIRQDLDSGTEPESDDGSAPGMHLQRQQNSLFVSQAEKSQASEGTLSQEKTVELNSHLVEGRSQQPSASGSEVEFPPSKKPKLEHAPLVVAGNDDSDGEQPSGATGRRGTRQPIKRGGRRF